MRPGKRFGLSAIEKLDIWSRWKAGQSLHEIGRAFDKPHSSIRCLLLPRGGIPPLARRPSRLALTLSEREDISPGITSASSLMRGGKKGQIRSMIRFRFFPFAGTGDNRTRHFNDTWIFSRAPSLTNFRFVDNPLTTLFTGHSGLR